MHYYFRNFSNQRVYNLAHTTYLIPELALGALRSKSALQVPVRNFELHDSERNNIYHKPKRLFLCEKLLPLLVDFTLHLELDFTKLENRTVRFSSGNAQGTLSNLLLFPAKLLFLQAYTLSGKLLRENRRVAENTALQP